MAPIEMQKLTTFPMERLCVDLKLKMLQQLDGKDVVELVKANKGFKWILSNQPFIVLGPHVPTIEIQGDTIKIEKLEEPIDMDIITHLRFYEKIRSCDNLLLWSHLNLELFLRLPIKIKKNADVAISFEEVPKGCVERFIEAQLGECEKVRFGIIGDDEFCVYYNALKKTRVKHIRVISIVWNGGIGMEGIQLIVKHGIPSKHPEAAFHCDLKSWGPDAKYRIAALLRGLPRVRELINKMSFIALAKDLFSSERVECDNPGWSGILETHCLCFRQGIDPTKDCIYVVGPFAEFSTFYIKADAMTRL